jgi:hypothetical protein
MDQSKNKSLVCYCLGLVTVVLLLPLNWATAGDLVQLKVKQVTASSDGTENPKEWPHNPKMAVDGDTKTCWASSTSDSVGAWLKFNFGSKKKISQIQIVNGWIPRGFPNFFTDNHRAKKITLQYDNGRQQTFDLKDNNDIQVLSPTLADETESVTLRVDEIYPAANVQTPWVTISEVTFFSPKN